METTRTYKAIITGLIVLFTGSLVWVMILREMINANNRDTDLLKLRNESVLSEKLQLEKALEKENMENESLVASNRSLGDSIKSTRHSLLAERKKDETTTQLLRVAQKKENEQQQVLITLQHSLDKARHQNGLTETENKIKTDSIKRLTDDLASLTRAHQLAAMPSIDHTLLVAERRNGRLTSKAKKVRKLVARVVLPARLGELSFVLTGPDGRVVNSENNFLIREVTDVSSLTASAKPEITPNGKLKTIEFVCVPSHRLKPGLYIVRIHSADVYIGSLTTVFAPRPR